MLPKIKKKVSNNIIISYSSISTLFLEPMYDANDDNQRNLFYCSGNPSFFLQIYVGKYRKGNIIVEIWIAKNSSLQPYHGI